MSNESPSKLTSSSVRSGPSAIRYRYLSKLAYKGVWNEVPKANNLVIFDWDDTLFPTSAFLLDDEEDFKRVKKRYS